MIAEIIKRGLMGVAVGGLVVFIVVTILMLNDLDISSTVLWFNMLGSFGVGIYFGIASLIFENENWSQLKQICIHFPLSVIVYFLIAVPLEWVPFTIWTSLAALGIFIIYYCVWWFGFWIYAKRQARKLNDVLNK